MARHLLLPDLDDVPALARNMAILGARHACSSGVRVWDRRTPADYRHAALALNKAGHALAQEGIQLHYHNHDFEFQVEAQPTAPAGMDLLLAAGDPAAWSLCLDVGWAQRGGSDPVAFLRAQRARVAYVHLRDFTADGGSTALGDGAIDLPSVVAEIADNPRIRWAMVEQEPGADPLADARRSKEYLQRRHAW